MNLLISLAFLCPGFLYCPNIYILLSGSDMAAVRLEKLGLTCAYASQEQAVSVAEHRPPFLC